MTGRSPTTTSSAFTRCCTGRHCAAGRVGPRQGGLPAAGPPGAVVLAVRSGPACGDVQVLTPGEHLVGRDATADVVVDDPEVSRHHASVVVGPPGTAPVVRDLGSTNGTRVDGAQHRLRGPGRGSGQRAARWGPRR